MEASPEGWRNGRENEVVGSQASHHAAIVEYDAVPNARPAGVLVDGLDAYSFKDLRALCAILTLRSMAVQNQGLCRADMEKRRQASSGGERLSRIDLTLERNALLLVIVS